MIKFSVTLVLFLLQWWGYAQRTWPIIPREGGGRKVITEKPQNSWLRVFEKTVQLNKLQKPHDIWRTDLNNKSENTPKGN